MHAARDAWRGGCCRSPRPCVLVALLMFALMHLLPGDPALMLLGDRGHRRGDRAAAPRDGAWTESMPVQFWRLSGAAWRRCNLGDSITMRVPVAHADRGPAADHADADRHGGGAGAADRRAARLRRRAARGRHRRHRDPRRRARSSLSMPVFYIGLMLLITLAAGLRWFPVGGIGDGFLAGSLLPVPAGADAGAEPVGDPAAQPAGLADRGAARRFVSFATAKGLPRRHGARPARAAQRAGSRP